jgi:predicted dienelactone hydrolase
MVNRLILAFCLVALATAAWAGPLRDRLQQRGRQAHADVSVMQMAGLKVAYWTPDEQARPAPMILFSHGFDGCKTQSVFLMQALANDGYIVMAPDHKDASCEGGGFTHRPDAGFRKPGDWSDQSHIDREHDIKALYAALNADKTWGPRIDWKRVGLAGHSLGGYTVMALAGAWPSWKMEGIKAVLALSPYVAPFTQSGDLGHLDIPVMYQGGTRDWGITPSVKKKGGAYDQTSSPAWFVEFDKTSHFGFTDLQPDAQQRIIDYSLWFFDHTLKGDQTPLPQEDGVTDLRSK